MGCLCCIVTFYISMTRHALQAQAKSRRTSIHSNIFDTNIYSTQNRSAVSAKRSLSMPDVYRGLINPQATICQILPVNRQNYQNPESGGSSRETLSSGLKTESSSSSIGSSRAEGTLSASMENLRPKKITKFTNHMKSYVMMGSSKR